VPASIDLNADLGEGGPADLELLDIVSSASVACGYHAGDPRTMLETARWAAEKGVTVGAHPSYDDRLHFGRQPVPMAPEALFASVLYQVGALMAMAAAAGTDARFVKPHGALYNVAATDPAVAEPVVRAVAAAGLVLLCPHGSELQRAADRIGLAHYAEGFADRAYSRGGRLVSRHEPGSVISNPREVAERAVLLATTGRIPATDGSTVRVAADSICIHGDTPGAAEIGRSVRRALEDAGVAVRSFAPG
jgi:UPF0271 protein